MCESCRVRWPTLYRLGESRANWSIGTVSYLLSPLRFSNDFVFLFCSPAARAAGRRELAMRLRWGLGPVFWYEWITISRRWQLYAFRSLFIAVLLAALAIVWRQELGDIHSWTSHETY